MGERELRGVGVDEREKGVRGCRRTSFRIVILIKLKWAFNSGFLVLFRLNEEFL